jgi:hypothetical protein
MTEWFQTGQEAVDQANKKIDFTPQTRRFYMKPGADATIVFLDGDNSDDEPIGNYKEHQFESTTGRWPNFASCTGAAGGCVFCKAGVRAYDAWPLTIIQIKPTWTDRDGNEHKNQRKLLIAKKESMQRLLRQIEKREGLAGTVWSIYRSNQRAYTIGDDWEFDKKIGGDEEMTGKERRRAIAKKLEIDIDKCERIDYREELKPMTAEELEAAGADVEGTKRRQESYRSAKSGGGSGGRSDGGDKGDGGVEVKY